MHAPYGGVVPWKVIILNPNCQQFLNVLGLWQMIQPFFLLSTTILAKKDLSSEKSNNLCWFREFTFDPSLTIHIDYQGKSKINIERNGAMLSMFRGFANLDKSQVTLKAIHHRNGLLGVSRCISVSFRRSNCYELSNWAIICLKWIWNGFFICKIEEEVEVKMISFWVRILPV